MLPSNKCISNWTMRIPTCHNNPIWTIPSLNPKLNRELSMICIRIGSIGAVFLCKYVFLSIFISIQCTCGPIVMESRTANSIRVYQDHCDWHYFHFPPNATRITKMYIYCACRVENMNEKFINLLHIFPKSNGVICICIAKCEIQLGYWFWNDLLNNSERKVIWWNAKKKSIKSWDTSVGWLELGLLNFDCLHVNSTQLFMLKQQMRPAANTNILVLVYNIH